MIDCGMMRYTFLVLLALTIPAGAADWPEFQGEGRQNVWSENGIIEFFSASQLKRKWSAPVGAGYSGPTVADEGVFVMDRPNEAQERILCLDRETGAEKWIHAYDCAYGQIGYGYGPRGCVTIHNGRAYAMGTMGHLHCLDAGTGEVIWSRVLTEEYQVDMPIWGLTSSPLVEGDSVIVQASAGPEGACVLALDRDTGKEKWRAFKDKASYVAPMVIDQAGQRVLIAWTGFRIAGMNPTDGSVFWEVETRPNKMPINVPGPAFNADKTRAFLSVFYDGSRLLEIDQAAPKAKQLWARKGTSERRTDALHAIISPPYIRGDYIYGIDSYGEMRCLEMASGDRIWEDQTATKYGRWSTVFMVRHGENTWMVNEQGELILAKLDEKGYHEISRAKAIEPLTPLKQRENGFVMWAPPAFANQCVYIKNDKELVCVSLAK